MGSELEQQYQEYRVTNLGKALPNRRLRPKDAIANLNDSFVELNFDAVLLY